MILCHIMRESRTLVWVFFGGTTDSAFSGVGYT